MEKQYTVIYSFFSSVLGLKGLAKEVFAIIFGFWNRADRAYAWVSLTTLEAITGGTRPAIVAAIKQLESKKIISAMRNPGKHSLYAITIDETLLRDFDSTFKTREVKPPNYPLVQKTTYNQESQLTKKSKDSTPPKYIINNGKRNRSLIIGDQTEFEKPDKL